MDISVQRLNESFTKSGYTQKELCEKTGITKGALSSYLSGRYVPKQEALEKLAHALDVSILYLMGIENEKPDLEWLLSASESNLLINYRRLNDYDKDKISDLVSKMATSGSDIITKNDGIT